MRSRWMSATATRLWLSLCCRPPIRPTTLGAPSISRPRSTARTGPADEPVICHAMPRCHWRWRRDCTCSHDRCCPRGRLAAGDAAIITQSPHLRRAGADHAGCCRTWTPQLHQRFTRPLRVQWPSCGAHCFVISVTAPIFAQLIYFAVSRKREYLGRRFLSSLHQISREAWHRRWKSCLAQKAQLKSANKVTAPMYIINPFKKKGMSISDLTSTHPPIADRIRILRSRGGIYGRL